jgi:hypothetical protein
MADYSKLSESDLEAIVNNDWNKVSEEGLKALVGERPKQRTIPEELMRQLGLTGRAAIQGALGLPSLIAQAPVSAIDLAIAGGRKLTGANVPTLGEIGVRPLEAGKNIATLLGLPEPESKLERMAGQVAEALTGVGATTIPAKILAQTGVSPVTRAVSQQLAENPQLQMLAGAGSASAAELAKERGAGPGGQFMAAMAGGMLVPGSGAASQIVGRAAPSLVRPLTQEGREAITGQILRKLSTQPESAIASLEESVSRVPGVRPMTAGASKDYGLMSAETPIRALDERGLFAQQLAENNAARQRELSRMTSPEKIAAAEAKREEITAPLREEAFAASTVTPDMFERVVTLTAGKQIDDILGSAAGARGTVEQTMKWASDQIKRGTTPERLYEVRKDLRAATLGKLDKPGSEYSLARAELQKVISSIDDALEASAPGYKDYLQTYAKMSTPINQMEELAALRQRAAQTGIPDPLTGERNIAPAQFGKLVDLLQTDPKTKLSKTQLYVLNNIARDLEQGATANLSSVRVPGSDTFKNISVANIMGSVIGKAMYGEPTGKTSAIVQKVMTPLNWLYNGSDDAIRSLLIEAMRDPKLAAQMMRKAGETTVVPLSEELKRKASAVGLGPAFGLSE